jgi:methionyl-tRNA synthetase
MTQRRILVTSALPYANGPLHLGHMVEHIQTDIWTRFQTLQGNHCLALCGDDAHGTPIMLKAEHLGKDPETLIAEVKADHEDDFAAFSIHYDTYHTTHSPENQALIELIFSRLQQNGDILTKTIHQAYDPIKNIFLPDRYVKGTCPKCDTDDQYGDNCENCGATYTPTDLVNPVSALSGATPVEKESEHYFFNLPKYQAQLEQWIQLGTCQAEVANKLIEWFEQGLTPWDISRDAPYFGFKIPGTDEKYFYVWLDAPIGYLASLKLHCAQHNEIKFEDYWHNTEAAEKTEVYHFIGKDIIYFHGLFWPAVLSGANFRLPNGLFVHGFLTVNGTKMSKSRGTFITAKEYLAHLPAEFLRYYFAAKLSPSIDDIDLNFTDFQQRINADLVGKLVNIASRCASFLRKHFNNTLASELDTPLLQNISEQGDTINTCYENRDYARAIRHIMALADQANQYIDTEKPWQKIKDPSQFMHVHQVCSVGINAFRILMIYLKPILPVTASKVEAFLNCPAFTWQDSQTVLLDHTINDYQPLLERIKNEAIDALLTLKQSQ